MNSRERFLSACRMNTLDRPPVWVMRQAGRYLPEYRALKEKHTFVEMVQTPELATEVTLQPLKRFELDAAILFSDILVIPEAMGLPYSFMEKGGIKMERALNTSADIQALDTSSIHEKLSYVSSALKLVRREIQDKKALIGFGGSPWTLATYMVEGGSSKSYSRIKSLLYENPDLFHQLMTKISDSLVAYFQMQIDAGVDVIQIFDSWGGILSYDTFWKASGRYMKEIISRLEAKVPVIVFSKGSHHWLADLKNTSADVLGFDWSLPLESLYDKLNGKIAVQGNLDPALMSTSPQIVEKESLKILKAMKNRPGFIFNLGHGILPDAKIDCMEQLVQTIQNYKAD